MDERERPKGVYVPLDVHVASKQTGEALKAKWGNDGLLVWILFIAACKRDHVPGTFTYTSEESGWGRLGALEANEFTLEQFFRYTGRQLHQTRKHKSGLVTYIACRNWGDWNARWKAQGERERKQAQRARVAMPEVVIAPHLVDALADVVPANGDFPSGTLSHPKRSKEKDLKALRDSRREDLFQTPALRELP